MPEICCLQQLRYWQPFFLKLPWPPTPMTHDDGHWPLHCASLKKMSTDIWQTYLIGRTVRSRPSVLTCQVRLFKPNQYHYHPQLKIHDTVLPLEQSQRSWESHAWPSVKFSPHTRNTIERATRGLGILKECAGNNSGYQTLYSTKATSKYILRG